MLENRKNINEQANHSLPVNIIIKPIANHIAEIKNAFEELFNEKGEPCNEGAGEAIISLCQHYDYLIDNSYINNLKDLEVEKLKILTTDGAIEAYKAGATPTDLKDLEVEKLKILTTDNTMAAYKAGARFEVEKISSIANK